MIETLAARLVDLAVRKDTISYGALAHALAIPGPGSIAALTTALEALMEQDAAAGLPLRAAVCRSKLNELPAPGFFQAAVRLGCYAGSSDGPDAHDFVHKTRAALFDLYGVGKTF